MNKIFGKGIGEVRKECKTVENEMNAFLTSFDQKITPELIGKLFANLFDFPQKTTGRGRGLDDLSTLSAHHLAITLEAFPEFKTSSMLNSEATRSEMLAGFIDEVKTQGWLEEREEIANAVKAKFNMATLAVISQTNNSRSTTMSRNS